jgi:hypothetical protein
MAAVGDNNSTIIPLTEQKLFFSITFILIKAEIYLRKKNTKR